jgi:hypothetical protein
MDTPIATYMTAPFSMPRQPEGKLVANARSLLRDRGARAFKIMGDAESFQEVGIPDLLVCYRGRFIGAEAKMPGNHPTAKQMAVLNEIVESGGYGLVFTTVEQVSRLLSKIDREVTFGAHSASRLYRYDLSSTGRSKRK